MRTESADDKYRAPALDKGLDILEFLAASPAGLTQAEISKGLDRKPNEIYRMLETLRRRRYVTRSPEGDRYTLSLRMLVLANIHPPIRRLLDIAEPLMRAFTRNAEQSVQLATIEDGQIVIATSFSAPGIWRLSIRPGAVIGLYNSGSGTVLAAFSDKSRLDAMIAEHQLVPGESKPDLSEFMQVLAKIRAQGYNNLPSQNVVGAINISFPVLDPEGRAIAAVSCPFLRRIDRYDAPGLDEVTEMMGELAAEVAAQLHGT